MEKKNTWETYSSKQLKEVDAFADEYRKFLDEGKTERECVDCIVNAAEKAGYRELQTVRKKGGSLKKGDVITSIGGIVGNLVDACTITNCVNYGPIDATSAYVGGITGFAYDESNVLNSANFGSVNGASCVGGIVGKTQTKKDYTCNVLNCYNVGTVYGKTYVGAIVGGRNTTDDAVHQCYYLQGCAKNSNGTVCKAVGINSTGSTDSENNLQIATFTSYSGSLIGNGGCGSDNLITALVIRKTPRC